MFRTIMVVSVALAVGAAAVVGARQLRQDQPGFETGAVPVTVANEPGVTVLNEPTVAARQAGSWTVSLSREQPLVAWTTPEFLQVGVAYTFNWPGGGSEEGRVLAVANGGWVRVETDASQLRWLNSSLAESIEASASAQRR